MTRLRLLKLLPAIALVCLIQTVVVAQTQKAKTVSIFQKFEPGKKYRIEIQKSKIDSEIPESELAKITTTAELTILSKKDSIRECSWRYGATSVTGADPLSVDNKKLNQNNGMEVRFIVDEKGAFKEMINFEECRNFLNHFFWILKQNDNTPKDKEEFKKMMELLAPTYNTPELFISTYCPEVNLCFSLFGNKLKTDTTYKKKTELLNPLGGPNFPSIIATQVDELTVNKATISVKTTIQKDKQGPILQESMKAIAQKNNVPYQETELPKFELSINSLYTYDITKNVLMEVYNEKILKMNEKKTIETLKIMMK